MKVSEQNLIGRGIYSIPEAARFIGLPPARIRRWINGYGNKNETRQPLLHSELPEIEGKVAISFHDLLELRFIKAFLDKGVNLPAIRHAAKLAAEIVGVESHPFITHNFMTDRKSILHLVGERMLNLNYKQYELEGIIKQSLFNGFIYENSAVATAWYPSDEEKSIIINPQYSLGKPIIERTGVRTRTIFSTWQAEERNIKIVANMFGLKAKEVREAVEFEQKMAA